jgi:hypothetical protein
MIAREAAEFGGVGRPTEDVAAQKFEQARERGTECAGGSVGDGRDPGVHTIYQRNCAIDLAKRPRREGQNGHCRDPRVLSEAESQIVISAGLE